MLFFKKQNAILLQKNFFFKEVYYKLYKLLVIFLKWNKILANLIIQKKKKAYYRNICVFSTKAKSISRKLKVSRIIIREMSNNGFFFGLHKLSW